MRNDQIDSAIYGFGIVAAAGALIGAVTTPKATAPWLAAAVALTVAVFTAATTNRRQRVALGAEQRRQTAALDAERERLDLRLAHEHELADIADLREVLVQALNATSRMHMGGYRSISPDIVDQVSLAFDGLQIRLPPDDPILAAHESLYIALGKAAERIESGDAEEEALATVRAARAALAQAAVDRVQSRIE